MPIGRILTLSPRTPGPAWTFLTNHAHVLVCLAADATARLRDVAERVGITERAVQHIVADLEAGGLLTRTREGRRNRYALHVDVPLRHPVEAHVAVRELLGLILPVPGHGAVTPPGIPPTTSRDRTSAPRRAVARRPRER
jgi:DNA-binding transcriptional ArsR family regulator